MAMDDCKITGIRKVVPAPVPIKDNDGNCSIECPFREWKESDYFCNKFKKLLFSFGKTEPCDECKELK
jgi:hypothetical protein